MSELTKQLRIKSAMIAMGERIAFGSDTALMDTAANWIDHLEAGRHQLKADSEVVADLAESRLAENLRLKAENERLGNVLRSIACSLGAGGYNASAVDPDVFEEKIRWGIDALTAPLITERDALRKQLTESQANDRCAMAYLADVRAVVGGTDFVCMVHNVTQMKKQLDEARELLNDSRNKINYMRQNGERYQPQFLLERIDAWMEANKK